MEQYNTETNKTEQLECVERGKLQTMTQICAWSGIACLSATFVFLLLGLALPFMVDRLTIFVLYGSMALEALSFASFKAYHWIGSRICN